MSDNVYHLLTIAVVMLHLTIGAIVVGVVWMAPEDQMRFGKKRYRGIWLFGGFVMALLTASTGLAVFALGDYKLETSPESKFIAKYKEDAQKSLKDAKKGD